MTKKTARRHEGTQRSQKLRRNLESSGRRAACAFPLRLPLEGVESGTGLEPCQLLFVVAVLGFEAFLLAVGVGEFDGHVLARGEILQTENGDAILFLDLVVVGRVHEGQRQHALLLEVGLVDAGQALGEHHANAQIAGFHGGVFAARAFTVVVVADDHGIHIVVLVVASNLGRRVVRAGFVVEGLADGVRKAVDGALEQVVRDAVEVAAVSKPLAPRRDVVGRALALGLDEDGQTHEVLAVPSLEGFEQLDALGVRAHLDFDLGKVGAHAVGKIRHEALHRQFGADRGLELNGCALGGRIRTLNRVEGQIAVDGHGHHDFGRGEEGVRLSAAVVAALEVAVEGLDDGVLLILVADRALPLADAGTAGGGKNRGVDLFKDVENAVALKRLIDAHRARNDHHGGLHLDAVVESLLGNRSSAREVFVGRVRAGADQSDLENLRIALFLDAVGNLSERHRSIGRVRTVDVRFELGEIDFDDAVVVLLRVGEHFLVGVQVGSDLLGHVGNSLAAGGVQIADHRVVEREDRGCGADFGTHVADGALAGAGELCAAVAEEFDDGVGAALGGENAGELQDHVLSAGPAVQFAGELDADDLGHLQFPFHAHQSVDEVGAAHADGEHAHAACSRGVVQPPATNTRTHIAALLPPRSSPDTGIANIATPTPNHPI